MLTPPSGRAGLRWRGQVTTWIGVAAALVADFCGCCRWRIGERQLFKRVELPAHAAAADAGGDDGVDNLPDEEILERGCTNVAW